MQIERARPMQGSDYHRIASAIRHVEQHADRQPRLADVARHLGLSEFHCQRLFHRWAGVTPKDFLQLLTLAHAKEALRRSESVMNAALSAGLSGPSRLHDLFLTIDALTPGEFRAGGKGLIIRWGVHPTPLGDALLAATERGLCDVYFLPDASEHEKAVDELRAEWPHASFRADASATKSAAREISSRIHGRIDQPLALLLQGTPFQIKVWQALLAIPEGAVTTYSRIAEIVGKPTAQRAVGSAIGANPISYLIPCHRVLRSTGAIGGYRWGEERKRAALVLEWQRASAAFV